MLNKTIFKRNVNGKYLRNESSVSRILAFRYFRLTRVDKKRRKKNRIIAMTPSAKDDAAKRRSNLKLSMTHAVINGISDVTKFTKCASIGFRVLLKYTGSLFTENRSVRVACNFCNSKSPSPLSLSLQCPNIYIYFASSAEIFGAFKQRKRILYQQINNL